MEDVDRLLAASEVEEYLMYVDSAHRDRVVYPTPADYTVTLDQPFINVVNVRVVEANVPRTMHVFDHGRRDMYVSAPASSSTVTTAGGCWTGSSLRDDARSPLPPSSPPFHRVRFDRQDVDLNDLLTLMRVKLAPHAINAEFFTARYQMSGRLVYTSPSAFAFDFGRSDIPEVMGFDQIATHPTLNRHEDGDGVLGSSTPNFASLTGRPGVFVSVPIGDTVPVTVGASVEGGVASDDDAPPTGATSVTFTVPVSIRSYPLLAGVTVVARAPPGGDGDGDDGGEKPSPTLVAHLTDPATGEALAPGIELVGAGAAAAAVGGAGGMWTMESKRLDEHPDTYIAVTAGGAYTMVLRWATSPNVAVEATAASVTLNPSAHRLTTPGVVALTGDRYVLLRVKELEDHLHGSYAYNSRTHPGVALFTIGAVSVSLQNQRLDFTNIALKSFHPIGKLNRLSFRFERPTGELYDFKNVNHHMLVAIRYLRPKFDPKSWSARRGLSTRGRGGAGGDEYGDDELDDDDSYDDDGTTRSINTDTTSHSVTDRDDDRAAVRVGPINTMVDSWIARMEEASSLL